MLLLISFTNRISIHFKKSYYKMTYLTLIILNKKKQELISFRFIILKILPIILPLFLLF